MNISYRCNQLSKYLFCSVRCAASTGSSAREVKRGKYFERHPQSRRSIRPVKRYYMQQAGRPAVKCRVISAWYVIRCELDALLNCLGGCPQGLSWYDAACGAENTWTAADQSALLWKTLSTATDTALICVMSNWSIHSGCHTFCYSLIGLLCDLWHINQVCQQEVL